MLGGATRLRCRSKNPTQEQGRKPSCHAVCLRQSSRQDSRESRATAVARLPSPGTRSFLAPMPCASSRSLRCSVPRATGSSCLVVVPPRVSRQRPARCATARGGGARAAKVTLQMLAAVAVGDQLPPNPASTKRPDHASVLG